MPQTVSSNITDNTGTLVLSEEKKFRSAFMEVDIAPEMTQESDILLQGFLGNPRVVQKVLSPLKMQILLLEDQQYTKLLIVTADIFGFGHEICQHVKTIAANWGISPEGIILNASHTHYSPGTVSHLNQGLGPFYPGYSKNIAQIITNSFPVLFSGLENCELSSGKIEAQLGVSQRINIGGQIQFGPNPEGYYDSHTPFLQIFLPSKNEKILLVNHSCRPTGIQNASQIFAGYPGFLREFLKKSGSANSIMFLQGVLGSSKQSDFDGDETTFSNDYSSSKKNGEYLARQLITGLEKTLDPVKGTFACVLGWAMLPLKALPSVENIKQVASTNNNMHIRQWASKLLKNLPNGNFPNQMRLPIQLVSIGDGLHFISLPVEPVAEYGKNLRTLSPNPDGTFVLGCTNGLLSYLTTDQQIREGGYEAMDSIFTYMTPSALEVGTEAAVLSKTGELFKTLKQEEDSAVYGRYHLAGKKRQAFFTLSSGRCGTLSLARLLDTAANAHVWHHPQPDPIYESLQAYWGTINKKEVFRRARQSIIYKTWSAGLIHGETDLLMTSFSDIIAEEIPDSKFIVLIRDPRDFVRSGMRRNYYQGHAWDPGRLRPTEGSEELIRFQQMDQFEKICWLWRETYSRINRFCADIPEDRQMVVRFEDLVKDNSVLKNVFDFLGLKPFNQDAVGKIIQQKFNEQVVGAFPTPDQWNTELSQKLWRECGEIAEEFGYTKEYAVKDRQTPVNETTGSNDSLIVPAEDKNKERDAAYYDTLTAFEWERERLRAMYEWAYSKLSDNSTIADIGSGTGPFTHVLQTRGFPSNNYWGVDFSEKRVEISRNQFPAWNFEVGDILNVEIRKKFNNFNTFVIFEVLEHIADDIGLLESIPAGSFVILSVPNFADPGHVRFFRNRSQAMARYSPNIEFRSAITFRSNTRGMEWYALEGWRKNDLISSPDSGPLTPFDT